MVFFRLSCIGLAICLVMGLVLALFPLEENTCRFSRVPPGSLANVIASPPSDNEHFLCILIPFRDRFEERTSMHFTAGRPQVSVPERWLDGNVPGKRERRCNLWEGVAVFGIALVNIRSHD